MQPLPMSVASAASTGAIWYNACGTMAAITLRPIDPPLLSDGQVTCGYHGLAFDKSGRCVHNPHGGISGAMNVASFPVIERHKALWIWLGERQAADAAQIPDLSYIDNTPETARIEGYLPTKAHYELMTDNILDLSHADYIHPTSLGGMMTSATTSTRLQGDEVVVEWDARDCVPPSAFRAVIPAPLKGDIWIQVRWTAPAVMTLATFAAPTGTPRSPQLTALTLHNMTPESAQSTHYFFCNTRPFLPDDLALTGMLRSALTKAFSDEDKPMLEKQQSRIGGKDFWALEPILLSVDAAAVRARRKLKQLIDAELSG
jgi:phenylpropionate dioxygenase-like ring-hydroxylating dioxygenase large terminal subunit